jgi:phytoene dehydrogenase-like protein
MTPETLIIGAGLAGLCCARRLQKAGRNFTLVEAADQVGGRIRTDSVEGFRLDRGFQVLQTAYPEAQDQLDYSRLQLRSFEPGALIRWQGRWHRLSDPWRRPLQGLRSLFSPIGSFRDKLRVAKLRARVQRGNWHDLFSQPETTTLVALQQAGFSEAMIERFFRPFLGGIFLERELRTSSRMFHFVFRMFAEGLAALPEMGMQAIPGQLVEALPPERIRLNSPVRGIDGHRVTLTSGEVLSASTIVLATDGPSAARLLNEPGIATPGESVCSVHFACEAPPIREAILLLNAEGHGPVNNLCFPSLVAPSYAPAGQHLVCASVLGNPVEPDEQLVQSVREQLTDWFGPTVTAWRYLRTDRIRYALPQQWPGEPAPGERPLKLREGLFLCGDFREQGSIHGAMLSGRRAAEAILAQPTRV